MADEQLLTRRKVLTFRKLWMAFRSPQYRMLYLHELYQFYTSKWVRQLLIRCRSHLVVKYGLDLPLDLKIGYGVRFPHGGPFVINPAAIIGHHVTIHPFVLIGGMRGPSGGSPKVGNHVFIGNGAKIIGPVKIGDYVFIAPGAVVVKDVNNGQVVGGNPANVLSNKGKEYVTLYS